MNKIFFFQNLCLKFARSHFLSTPFFVTFLLQHNFFCASTTPYFFIAQAIVNIIFSNATVAACPTCYTTPRILSRRFHKNSFQITHIISQLYFFCCNILCFFALSFFVIIFQHTARHSRVAYDFFTSFHLISFHFVILRPSLNSLCLTSLTFVLLHSLTQMSLVPHSIVFVTLNHSSFAHLHAIA